MTPTIVEIIDCCSIVSRERRGCGGTASQHAAGLTEIVILIAVTAGPGSIPMDARRHGSRFAADSPH